MRTQGLCFGHLQPGAWTSTATVSPSSLRKANTRVSGGGIRSIRSEDLRSRPQLLTARRSFRVGTEVIMKPPAPHAVTQLQDLRRPAQIGILHHHAVVRRQVLQDDVVVPIAASNRDKRPLRSAKTLLRRTISPDQTISVLISRSQLNSERPATGKPKSIA